MTSEFILCAAIRISSRLFTGKHHGECLKKMKSSSEQGFLVDSYVGTIFVNRKDALEIAIAAGQTVNKHNPKNELLSEDLADDKRFNP